MTTDTDITLEDVESAIRVLNAFIKRSREATIVLRRVEAEFRSGKGGMPLSFQDFVGMAFREAKAKQEAQTEPTEEPFTEEDLKRMREIKSKLKGQRP